VLHPARWKIQDAKITQKLAICAPCTTLLGYIFVSTIEKILNSNISSTCPHNMVNFDPLTAEIGCRVWGIPANFNGFRVLASLLHRHRSTEVNQTLHDVLLSPGLVYIIYRYIYFRGSCPLMEFYQVQNSLSVQVLHSPILAILVHGTLCLYFQLQLLPFQTPIFGRVTIMWYCHATSSRLLKVVNLLVWP